MTDPLPDWWIKQALSEHLKVTEALAAEVKALRVVVADLDKKVAVMDVRHGFIGAISGTLAALLAWAATAWGRK